MTERTNIPTGTPTNTHTPNPTSKSNGKIPIDLTLSNDFLDPLRTEFFSDTGRFQVSTRIDDTPNPLSPLTRPPSKATENAINRSETLENTCTIPNNFINSTPTNAREPARSANPGITPNNSSEDLEIRKFVRGLIPYKVTKHSEAIIPLINCTSPPAEIWTLNGGRVQNGKNNTAEGLPASQPLVFSPTGNTILPYPPPAIPEVEPLTPPQSISSTTIDDGDALDTEKTSQADLTILNGDGIRLNSVSIPQATADGALRSPTPQKTAPFCFKGIEKAVEYDQNSEPEVPSNSTSPLATPACTRNTTNGLRHDAPEFVPSFTAAIFDPQPPVPDEQPYKEYRPTLPRMQSWLVKLNEKRKQRQLELERWRQLEVDRETMRPTKRLIEEMIESLYDDEPSEHTSQGLEMPLQVTYEPGEVSGLASAQSVDFPSTGLPTTVTHNNQGCSRWLLGLICSESTSRAFRMINNFPWPREVPEDLSTCRPSSNVLDDDTISVTTNDYEDEEQGIPLYLPTTQELQAVSNDTEPINDYSSLVAQERYKKQHRENDFAPPISVSLRHRVNSTQSGKPTIAPHYFRAVPTGSRVRNLNGPWRRSVK
jgi:hypothetical protein